MALLDEICCRIEDCVAEHMNVEDIVNEIVNAYGVRREFVIENINRILDRDFMYCIEEF